MKGEFRWIECNHWCNQSATSGVIGSGGKGDLLDGSRHAGERFQSGGHVQQADVRVPIYRQGNRGMPRECLRELWMNPILRQAGDELVAKGVEVEHAIIRRIGDARSSPLPK